MFTITMVALLLTSDEGHHIYGLPSDDSRGVITVIVKEIKSV